MPYSEGDLLTVIINMIAGKRAAIVNVTQEQVCVPALLSVIRFWHLSVHCGAGRAGKDRYAANKFHVEESPFMLWFLRLTSVFQLIEAPLRERQRLIAGHVSGHAGRDSPATPRTNQFPALVSASHFFVLADRSAVARVAEIDCISCLLVVGERAQRIVDDVLLLGELCNPSQETLKGFAVLSLRRGGKIRQLDMSFDHAKGLKQCRSICFGT